MEDDRLEPQTEEQLDGLEDRLKGWKEISDFLHSSQRTVQRWEQQFSLPIHRVASPNNPRGNLVFACRAELIAWQEQHKTESEPWYSKYRRGLALGAVALVLLAAVASILAMRAVRPEPYMRSTDIVMLRVTFDTGESGIAGIKPSIPVGLSFKKKDGTRQALRLSLELTTHGPLLHILPVGSEPLDSTDQPRGPELDAVPLRFGKTVAVRNVPGVQALEWFRTAELRARR